MSWLLWRVLLWTSVQFSSVAQSCLTLCNSMNCSMPGLPVHPQLLEFTQTHVHWVGDATQPSHPLSSPSPPALKLSQHQGLFKWVSSSYQVAKVLRCLYIFELEFCLDICSWVGLLNHMAVPFLVFWDTFLLFYTMAAPTTSTPVV